MAWLAVTVAGGTPGRDREGEARVNLGRVYKKQPVLVPNG